MSFYLTYRPQTIEELDLEKVREQLQSIIRSGEFSHAYLFAGPKGTGKTSSARIVSKLLNCESNAAYFEAKKAAKKSGKKLHEPCNKCETCQRITRGSSLAVMEMDAASNRGIDDIRELRERIGLAPSEGRFTCYVIDEVHMLTTEAFNALLKTLEEPPEHAIFFLCTTELHKIPDTVISRCTQVNYYKATSSEVVRSLTKAVKGEGLVVEDGVLQAISTRVDGSFRDGMKMLEQLSRAADEITVEMVDELTGFSNEYDPRPLIKGLIEGDVKRCFEILQDKEAAGVSLQIFANRVIESLRKLLQQQVMSGKSSGIMDRDDLVALLRTIINATAQMKQVGIEGLPFEVAVAEWCLGRKKSKTNGGRGGARGNMVMKQGRNGLVGKRGASKKLTKRDVQAKSDSYLGGSERISVDINEIESRWVELLEAVRVHNHSLEALLRFSRPVACNDGVITLGCRYSFHMEQLMQERHRRVLEGVFGELLGGKVRFTYELSEEGEMGSTKNETIDITNVTGALDDESLAQAAEEIFGV